MMVLYAIPAVHASKIPLFAIITFQPQMVTYSWEFPTCTLYGQVKSSSGATHSRSEHPNPNLFLPPPLRGLWRGLNGVGRQEEPQRSVAA